MIAETGIPHAEQVMATCRHLEPHGCRCAVCLARALGSSTPTKEQADVIEADPQQPLLVVAGAGSGKTTTMADRVVWLCANQYVRPDQILGVTFTNKAATGLRRKVSEQLGKLAASGLVPAEQLITGVPSPASQYQEDHGLRDLLAPAVSTYNSYANSLIKQYGTLVGIEPHSDLGGEARLWQLARSIVDRLAGPGHGAEDGTQIDVRVLLETDRAPRTVTADLMSMSDQCAEHGQEPLAVAQWIEELLSTRIRLHGEPPDRPRKLEELLRSLRYQREIALLAAHFDRRRRDEGLLSYADQLTGAAKVAQELQRARREQRSQYRIVLLDEFQDTSFVQSSLFSTLYGSGHSVTAVGDPNQSIYGFRGASAGQLFAFRERFPTAAGAKPEVKYLTTAWRNGPRILTAANTLLEHFGARETLQKPWHTATAKEVSKLAGPHADKRLSPSPARQADNPGRVTVGWYETSAEEADAVVAHLQAAYLRVWKYRQRLAKASGRPAQRPTLAVLTRTHRQLDAVVEAFDRQQATDSGCRLIYERTGLSGLLSTPEVHEVLCYLRVLADPTRADVVIRILAADKYRIGPADLYRIGQHVQSLNRRFQGGDQAEEQRTMFDAIADLARGHSAGKDPAGAGPVSAEALRRVTELWRVLTDLRQWSAQGLSVLVERIIDQTGLKAEVEARAAALDTSSHQLHAFAKEAETFELTNTQASLHDFLEWVDAAEEQEKGLSPAEVETNPEAVQLMTMHAAKGLEWDVVATLGWRAPDFPSHTASDPWTDGGGWLPWPLRGDAENLPRWGTEAAGEEWRTENTAYDWNVWCYLVNGQPAKAHDDWLPDPYLGQLPEFRAEEDRRLAYVATTRAADELIVTGSLFSGTGKGTDRNGNKRNPRMRPSEFLCEIAAAMGESNTIKSAHERFTRVQNPSSLYATEALWPYDPLEGRTATRVFEAEGTAAEHGVPERETVNLSGRSRRAAVDAAAAAVYEALHKQHTPQRAETPQTTQWIEETELVLAQRREGPSRVDSDFPEHLSASNLVALDEDVDATVKRLRRPVPQQPRKSLRRGTQTHAWIEQHLGNIQQPIFETDHESLGAEALFSDDETRAKFLKSQWAKRPAFALEMNFATPLGSTVIRGQIDAIYGYDTSVERHLTLSDKERLDRQPVDDRNERMQSVQWHLVDWKTGSPPTRTQAWESRKIQLAVYRLAFHRMYGVPLERITTSFHYVDRGEEGETKTVPHDELPTAVELRNILVRAEEHFFG